MKQHLPHSLLAVFYTSAETRERAAGVHAEFLQAYGLQAARFPLLRFSTQSGFSDG
jgi:hypothetical protein